MPSAEHLRELRSRLLESALAVIAGITLAFKVAFFGGLMLAAPVWLYQAWAFIAPGLYKNEKRYSYGFTAAAFPMFGLGCALCYVTFPKIMGGALLGSGFTPRGGR